MSTAPDLDERTQPVTGDGDHDRYAHIVERDDEMRGYVMGEEVRALCGKKWVPSRDPSRYRVCPACKEILAQLRSGSDHGSGSSGSGSGEG